MAKGDPCKDADCPNVQPCPTHTRLGKMRVHRQKPPPKKLLADDNVHALFTEQRQREENPLRPRAGKKRPARNGSAPDPEVDNRRKLEVRQRIGKRWSQVFLEVKGGMYTWAEFVEMLDAEELARGQLRADDGSFRGKAPDFIPRQFYLACQREMVGRFNELMQANLLKASEELIQIGMDKMVDPQHRAKVLQYVIERVVGKIPDKVEVHAADPWETIIGDILAEAPPETQAPSYVQARDEPE